MQEIEEFNKRMNFDEYLVPYDWNIDWIEEEIDSMVSLMNNDKIPVQHPVKIVLIPRYAKLVCNSVKDDSKIQGNLF